MEKICSQFKQVYPVNYNAPGQLVVAGAKEEMDDFNKAIREAGGRGMPVAVGGGFHSPFMDEAAQKFGETAATFELKQPDVTVYSNFTTEPYTEDVRYLMENQINHSLRWQESIERMAADGFDAFIEVGVGDTLKKLIKRILPEAKVYHVSNMEEIEKVKEELAC
ncbi:MAG: ACP S-malonyltransferase [Anaerotignum sp.]|nr:ACP S-malonyltransferase [Anaerotignum sp.]